MTTLRAQVKVAPRDWREGRRRGVAASRLAASIEAAATGAEGIEHEALARLAETAAALARRGWGVRGWRP